MTRRTIVLVIEGLDALAETAALCARVRAAFEADAADLLLVDVERVAHPDLGAIDALAQIGLAAIRRGGRVRLLHASEALLELVALAGLGGVLPSLSAAEEAGAAFSALEPGRKVEERKQALGVEEERDPRDPSV
jgi:ABC-type transporter Mla MlaB component